MNWAAENQRMQEWVKSPTVPAPHAKIERMRDEFDSSTRRTGEALADLFANLSIFEPAGWVSTDDALLSPEQWRYLSGK